eukprot:6100219-Pyramimonas_sp.AAC.1
MHVCGHPAWQRYKEAVDHGGGGGGDGSAGRVGELNLGEGGEEAGPHAVLRAAPVGVAKTWVLRLL